MSLPLFIESPRRVLLGNPYSPSRIPTRDRQRHGWLNIQLVSRSRTATPEGPQLGSPRCRVIVGPRSYCIGAFPAAVAFVPPLSLLLAKVLWYSSDSRLRSWDTPSLKSCAYSPGCLAGFFSEPVFIRPHRPTVPGRTRAGLFSESPRRVLLGNSQTGGHKKRAGVLKTPTGKSGWAVYVGENNLAQPTTTVTMTPNDKAVKEWVVSIHRASLPRRVLLGNWASAK
jgi:hypothetical protein